MLWLAGKERAERLIQVEINTVWSKSTQCTGGIDQVGQEPSWKNWICIIISIVLHVYTGVNVSNLLFSLHSIFWRYVVFMVVISLALVQVRLIYYHFPVTVRHAICDVQCVMQEQVSILSHMWAPSWFWVIYSAFL